MIVGRQKLIINNNNMRRKYSLDEKVFDNINEESSYWLGFLYGDGSCTNENKVRITISQKDKDLLISFRDFIKSINRPIKEKITKINGKEYYGSHLEFRSWRIHNAIKKYELTKIKSKRGRLHIDFLQPEIRRHFIRGLFDADGTFYYDGKNKQKLFSEITGQKSLLKDIKNILVLDNVIRDNKKIVKNGSIFRIRMAAEDTIKLINYIYKGNPKYKLKRKFNLAKSYRERLNE